MLSEEEIEAFITYLDKKTRDLCVHPDGQNIDCCDCYTCRVAYFNWVREDLRRKYNS